MRRLEIRIPYERAEVGLSIRFFLNVASRLGDSNVCTRTSPETATLTGRYTTTVSDLHSGSTYVFRAVATANGTDYTGNEQTFRTLAKDGSPSIDDFTISMSEQLGENRMFTVKWSVADPTADLDTVEVVTVQNITSMNFAVTDVSGASASGWNLFQFPVGSTLNVTLRVTDQEGTVTKETKKITL